MAKNIARKTEKLRMLLVSIAASLLCLQIASGANSVLFDCGSAGTRVYIYEFVPRFALETIGEVAHKRSSRALSTFIDDLDGLLQQFASLLSFAKQHIPEDHWAQTSVFMKATGGLRDMELYQQDILVNAVRNILSESGFNHQANQSKVISGQEEALFDLLGVMATLRSHSSNRDFAAADLGGSSQQIAYAYPSSTEIVSFVDEDDLSTSYCFPDYRMTIPNYGVFDVVAKSFHQRGLIAAMTNAFNEKIAHLPSSLSTRFPSFKTVRVPSAMDGTSEETIENGQSDIDYNEILACLSPPLPSNHNNTNSKSSSSNNDDRNKTTEFLSTPIIDRYHVHGTGIFELCREAIKDRLLPLMKETVDFRCLRSRLPSTIIGIDNFPKVLEMLGIDDHETISPAKLATQGTRVCQEPWEVIQSRFPTYPLYRSQRACFGASYIHVILTEVYGIAPEDDMSFLPMNMMGSQELSWAAGAAVWDAMKLKVEEWHPSLVASSASSVSSAGSSVAAGSSIAVGSTIV